MQVKKQQLEPDMQQWTGSQLGNDYVKAVYCIYRMYIVILIILYAEYIMQNAGLDQA